MVKVLTLFNNFLTSKLHNKTTWEHNYMVNNIKLITLLRKQ